MQRPNVFGRLRKETNERCTNRLIVSLDHWYNLRYIGYALGSLIFEVRSGTGHPWAGRWFTVCDNGGELNLQIINREETTLGLPYTHSSQVLTVETMAYRIALALREGATMQDTYIKAINWDHFDTPGAYSKEPLKLMEPWP